MSIYHHYKTLAIFAMILTVGASNYLVQFPLNNWLTVGAFTYPISFVITEVINRLYGPRTARQIVYIGFFLAVILSIWMATVQIAVASGAAFLASQLLDIFIFNKLKQFSWWVAPFSASLMASLVDTLVFWIALCWGENFSLVYALGDFFVKVSMDVILLFPFRLLTKRLSFLFSKSILFQH